MDDLIEALTIFRKYTDEYAPTGCDHDILRVWVDPVRVSGADKARLEELGFHIDTEDDGCFGSFRFGSA